MPALEEKDGTMARNYHTRRASLASHQIRREGCVASVPTSMMRPSIELESVIANEPFKTFSLWLGANTIDGWDSVFHITADDSGLRDSSVRFQPSIFCTCSGDVFLEGLAEIAMLLL